MSNYILESEIDGNVSKKLIDKLNMFIRAIGRVFHIHCFTKGAHSKSSLHYKGKAVDGHSGANRPERKPTTRELAIMFDNLVELVEKENKSVFEEAVLARLCGFGGIGIYPHWMPKAGLHLDIRETPLVWIGLNSEKLREQLDKTTAKQIYLYLT